TREKAPVRVQAQRDGLREHDHVLALADVRAGVRVGGEAVHQHDGEARALGVAQLPVEERDAVHRLDEPLHSAAEAGRHAAVEDGHGGAVEVRVGVFRQRHELVLAQRLQLAAAEVRLLRELPAGDALSQLVEEALVEAVALEDLVDAQNAYGGRWMPSSVTIAAISEPGVTSKAGLRAGKRVVTSAGSRSSIGIALPSRADGSSVEVGATT